MADELSEQTSEDDPTGSGEFEIGKLFGRANRPWGALMFVAALGAALLGWLAGANGLALLSLACLAGVVIGAIELTRWHFQRTRETTPTWVVILLLAVANFVATGLSVTYRGIEGGLWFALLFLAFVAGQTLPTRTALVMGGLGSLLLPAIALTTRQFDLAHAPAIFGGSVFVFVASGVALAQRNAVVQLVTDAYRERLELLEKHSVEIAAMVDSLSEGFLTTDDSGLVTTWNPALEKMTGIRLGDALGKPVEEVLPLADSLGPLERERHPCIKASGGRVVEGGPLAELGSGIFLTPPNKAELPVMISAAPLPEGSISSGVVAIVADVSKVHELNDMRDALIAMVSHELRTPLTSTLGFAELLAEGNLSPEDARRSAREIMDSASRLASMIDDLLVTSAIEAGQFRLTPELVPVADIVTASITALSDEERSRVDLDVPGDVMVKADPERLGQVITNLLGNGLKYSDPGERVSLRVEKRGRDLALIVADSGQGIPSDEVGAIFDKFRRSDDARYSQVSGTGLGLFIADKIVKAHGGRIEVESKVGEGSVFTVYIPG